MLLIAFKSDDHETLPQLQAERVADLDGIGRAYRESEVDVHFVDAVYSDGHIVIPVHGPENDVEDLQPYFSVPIFAPEDHSGIAVCIGCGCDDLHACWDDKSEQPCSWLRVDRAAGLGVCSVCLNDIERWDSGDRVISVPA